MRFLRTMELRHPSWLNITKSLTCESTNVLGCNSKIPQTWWQKQQKLHQALHIQGFFLCGFNQLWIRNIQGEKVSEYEQTFVFVYLKGRERETDRKRSSSCRFTPQVPTTNSILVLYIVGIQVFGPLPAAAQGVH